MIKELEDKGFNKRVLSYTMLKRKNGPTKNELRKLYNEKRKFIKKQSNKINEMTYEILLENFYQEMESLIPDDKTSLIQKVIYTLHLENAKNLI
jgi:hypothetical protein